MAYTTTTPGPLSTIRDRVLTILSRMGQGYLTWLDLRSRRERIERLHALSDAELAALGLTRDQIVMHVFRDRLYY